MMSRASPGGKEVLRNKQARFGHVLAISVEYLDSVWGAPECGHTRYMSYQQS